MSTGYDKSLEALQRGETVRLRRWKTQAVDQHGKLVEGFETVALFEARLVVDGDEVPLASRVLLDSEASALAKLPGVLDERDGDGLSE